ncbi:hypothetical protein [uncultured Clostridium sp.]|uniref:hypothetical protein n=1 Tax=uncultured Clostridium sp. TaxID=59620 RepID=UPI0028E7C3A0|nr:hypothetical protein [uncultured Clostridium sp.]
MFNLLGVGERAGSGLENIHLAWREQKRIFPDLEETYDPDRITLTLKTTSILPKESIEKLKSVLKEKYSKLSKDEVMALVYVIKNGYITNSICKSELGLEKYKSVRLFNSLMKKEVSGNKIRYVLK